jgi:hypothetical protein
MLPAAIPSKNDLALHCDLTRYIYFTWIDHEKFTSFGRIGHKKAVIPRVKYLFSIYGVINIIVPIVSRDLDQFIVRDLRPSTYTVHIDEPLWGIRIGAKKDTIYPKGHEKGLITDLLIDSVHTGTQIHDNEIKFRKDIQVISIFIQIGQPYFR